uniref:Protein draper-like n=1 Tax=Crassostrea virginica TaxID=6565 RepID=A0A8B8AKE8_CRAVI|nr:protein draper-like [Crassostrea virginica]
MRIDLCCAVLILLYQGMKAKICSLYAGDRCCSGYKWNKTTKLCDKCSIGYDGPQCAYSCTYPFYGEDCRNKCDCTEEQCDFIFGCKANSTTMGHIEGTTDVSPASRISTSSVNIVFYSTIALIAVCVVFLLIYGVSYFLKKYFLRKQRINSTMNVGVKESVYSHYEEVKSCMMYRKKYMTIFHEQYIN